MTDEAAKRKPKWGRRKDVKRTFDPSVCFKVEVGNRIVRRRFDEVLIGQHEEWQVYRVQGWCNGNWWSLKIYRDKARCAKNVYYLGWNWQRKELAKKPDAFTLLEYDPEIHEWLVRTLSLQSTIEKNDEEAE